MAPVDVMTAAEVAALLKLRPSTIEDYARRGLLPSVRFGKHRRFIRGDVVAAVDEQRSVGSRKSPRDAATSGRWRRKEIAHRRAPHGTRRLVC